METIRGLPRPAARLDASGNATIELPADLDESARDYSLRIEARVTDASNREVTGSTFAHATVGTFLIAATLDTYVVRPGGTATLGTRGERPGVPQAAASIVWPYWPGCPTQPGTRTPRPREWPRRR